MINRINTYRHEIAGYPFVDNSVYPNGLILDISIMLDKDWTIYVDSVVVTDTKVEMTLSKSDKYSDNTDKQAFGYGVYTKGEDSVMSIVLEDGTKRKIGWAILGTMINTIGYYEGSSEVCSSCIKYFSPNADSIVVNGIPYSAPESIDISVLGSTYIYNIGTQGRYILDGVIGDSEFTPEVFRDETTDPVRSINGSNCSTLTIRLPALSEDPSNDNSDALCYSAEAASVDEGNIVITITGASNNPGDTPFSCPPSDILPDFINVSSDGVLPIETPLDDFIHWYKSNVYNKWD